MLSRGVVLSVIAVISLVPCHEADYVWIGRLGVRAMTLVAEDQ
jgi:hypothetical protein